MTTTASAVSRPAPTAAIAAPKAAARLLFVDNIRVFLTILVLLHHMMIIYAGTGDWIYNEGRQDIVTKSLGGWFCAVDQAYFMGLFLLISAYFVPGSYDRKGAGRFLKDRLIRLGIPLAIYSWIINPLFIYAVLTISGEINMPFWQFFPGVYFQGSPLIGAGPLWFVEVLLIFSLVYVVWRLLARSRPAEPTAETPFPANRTIAVFALLLGLAGFLVRLVFPMDLYNFKPLNLQFPFFAQYIALFIAGLVAYRRNWLVGMPDQTGRFWLRAAVLMILLWAPMVLAGGALDSDLPFKGGWHWQALAYALWEAFTCLSLCISVVYLFRRYLNRQGRFSGFFVPNAYTAYVIHAPVITTLAFGLSGLLWYPLLKWVVVGAAAVLLCFALSIPIRRIPYADRVL